MWHATSFQGNIGVSVQIARDSLRAVDSSLFLAAIGPEGVETACPTNSAMQKMASCAASFLVPAGIISPLREIESPILMGDEGHQYHAMELLIYAYLQSGRDPEAAKLIEEICSSPQLKDMYGSGFDPQISAPTSFSASMPLSCTTGKKQRVLPLISPADGC